MKKKILLSLITVVVIVGGVAAMSAYEAHVINVTAKIENALNVPIKEIDFGTVFPQEKLIENIWISLSGSFMEEDRVDDVAYEIHQKTKFKVFPKADVLFAFDTTGSMIGAIAAAKTNAIAIMDNLGTLISDVGFGVVKFEDYPILPYGLTSDTPYLLTQAITTDTTTAAAAIDALTLGNGGDGPQSYTRVMYESYTDSAISWRPGAQRILIILGDNVSHDDNLTQDPIYGTAPWGGSPWVTGYPPTHWDPGPDGVAGNADDLDFQPTLKAMADNDIILYFLRFATVYPDYTTNWDWWASKTGGSAVSAGDYGDIVEAIKGLFAYKDLCSHLSKVKKLEDPDIYQGDPNIPDDTDVPVPHEPGVIASGYMSKLFGDTADGWDIDLKVPCFEGMCAQDYDPNIYGPPLDPRLESQDFGCDLWIEVTGISRVETVNLENKDGEWAIIVDDTHGMMTYSIDHPTFYGNVVAQKLEPSAKYQITLNGPGGCSATDDLLASAGSNLFQSGYWNNWVPGLAPNCVGSPGEGVYNMALISDWYTVETDASGDFNYSFNLNLPSGSYTGVKVLVKKVLEVFAPPWVDTSVEHTTNLFETAPINFTILP